MTFSVPWRAFLRSRFFGVPACIAVVVIAWNVYISMHDDGVVRGRVVDASGKPVEGATVLMLEETFTTHTDRGRATTGPDGGFEFLDNRSHHLLLRAEKAGVGRSEQQEVRLAFRAQHVDLASPIVLKASR
jgi:Carboxypeptidase regulatory-like domain